ncbi:hypothetical protein BT69DRAFT_1284902 [Atractiella rhizophila]|nr:hypothetical protein BT69DRAFT_1284902 [Atractiella rhizophila]
MSYDRTTSNEQSQEGETSNTHVIDVTRPMQVLRSQRANRPKGGVYRRTQVLNVLSWTSRPQSVVIGARSLKSMSSSATIHAERNGTTLSTTSIPAVTGAPAPIWSIKSVFRNLENTFATSPAPATEAARVWSPPAIIKKSSEPMELLPLHTSSQTGTANDLTIPAAASASAGARDLDSNNTESRSPTNSDIVRPPDVFPLLATILSFLLGFVRQEDSHVYQVLFNCLNILLAGTAWVDISSRWRARDHKGRESIRSVIPWLLFWTFHMYVTFGIIVHRLDKKKRWTVTFLPTIVLVWVVAISSICRRLIKQTWHNSLRFMCGH